MHLARCSGLYLSLLSLPNPSYFVFYKQGNEAQKAEAICSRTHSPGGLAQPALVPEACNGGGQHPPPAVFATHGEEVASCPLLSSAEGGLTEIRREPAMPGALQSCSCPL